MKLETLKIKTKKFFDVIDLTDNIENFLEEVANGKDGLVNVFTRHTTVAVKINEKEDGFLEDLKQILFSNIASPHRTYFHNDLEIRDPATLVCSDGGEECLNGHSHVAQMFLGTSSETIPVKDGKMMLGTWQRVFMFELDHQREREIILSFIE